MLEELEEMEGEISTHAPRVRRDFSQRIFFRRSKISTHAPRVRRDRQRGQHERRVCDFYSRASCEARRGRFLPSNKSD